MNVIEKLKTDWAMATEIHKLEARLWRLAQTDGLQVILFTSGTRGEGKSTTVAYLAAALGQYPERKVLAVDLDLRSPTMASLLEIDAPVGLEAVLEGVATPADVVVRTSLPGLDVLVPSPPAGRHELLLRTRSLYELFQWGRRNYDIVLVDAPATIPVADSSLLVPFVDGVVLVGMAGRTTRDELRDAREHCLKVGGRILGLVIGNSQEAIPGYNSHYYTAYAGSTKTHQDPQ